MNSWAAARKQNPFQMSFFTVHLRGFLRPNITSVKAKLYENGKEKNIDVYDENRLRILGTCINQLWNVPEGTPYWFESDFVVESRCFKTRKTYVEVTCYTYDPFSPQFKKKMEIPIRYRKKMFDKVHKLQPAQFSTLHWPSTLEVKFILRDT